MTTKFGFALLLSIIILIFGSAMIWYWASENSDYLADIPPHYRWLWERPEVLGEVAVLYKSIPIDSIQMERRPCHGRCPVYEVTLRRYGDATFEGKSSVPRQGTFRGRVNRRDYTKICFLIEQIGIAEADAEYLRPSSDAATTILRVYRHGEADARVIKDYGEFGPIELWAVHQVIDAISEQIEWSMTAAPSN